MKQKRCEAAGLTILEVLLVICIVVVLTALFLPRFARVHPKYHGHCPSNLKTLALGFFGWAADGQKDFPMRYRTNDSGS